MCLPLSGILQKCQRPTAPWRALLRGLGIGLGLGSYGCCDLGDAALSTHPVGRWHFCKMPGAVAWRCVTIDSQSKPVIFLCADIPYLQYHSVFISMQLKDWVLALPCVPQGLFKRIHYTWDIEKLHIPVDFFFLLAKILCKVICGGSFDKCFPWN